MLRTVLKPKWLGLLALVLLVVGAFTWLGFWQFGVAQERQAREAAERVAATPVQPLDQVIQPHSPLTSEMVGLRVTATGTYDASKQLIITPRELNGSVGAWVMTPLDTGEAYLPVVRGWVSDPSQVKAPPSGTVTVHGVLAPPESAPDESEDLPDGQRHTIDTASLVNSWDHGIYNTFIYATAEQNPDGGAVQAWSPTQVPPPSIGPGDLQWRNLAYAMQWWFFAAFAVYMWIRMVADDAATDRALAAGTGPRDTEPTIDRAVLAGATTMPRDETDDPDTPRGGDTT